MLSKEKIKNIARNCIDIELKSISDLKERINDEFFSIVKLISSSKGRLIIIGVGKSADISRKVVATFNSTGQPSIFLHATDAMHGDLGSIQKEDIIMFISKSGNTPEIKSVVSEIITGENLIISITGNVKSYLAQKSNFVIDASVEREACLNDLIPTSSTTAQLIIGDALAISLFEYNNYTKKDFARFHPGGTLGKRLSSTVLDIVDLNNAPKVQINDSIKNVILEISNKRLGATAVFDNNKLCGIITDGDLRRMLERKDLFSSFTAKDIMNKNPIFVQSESLAYDSLKLMESNNISQLLVLSKKKFLGIIHIHDILKIGVI